MNTMLSARGWLLSVFLCFIFSFSVLKEADIVAAVLVYSFAAYVALLSLGTLILARKMKSGVSVLAFQPETSGHPEISPGTAAAERISTGTAIAGRPAIFALRISEVYIPPGFYLEVQVQFEQGRIKLAKHILTGKLSEGHILSEPLIFPHRGYWRIQSVNFYLADKLNLTFFKWRQTDGLGTRDLLVNPEQTGEIAVPVISSSNRSGDTLPDLREKQGDPFDLKAYHPSDGLNRILWKLYAKSGELISRHPEASMTPEGQVLAFSFSPPEAEDVCAVTLAYLKIIEALNLEILFACLGMPGSQPARSAEQARELLVETVWDADISTAAPVIKDMQVLIDAFHPAGNARLDRVIIFCSKSGLGEAQTNAALTELAFFLETLSVQPFFCFCRRAWDNQEHGPGNGRGLLEKLFFSETFAPREIDIKLAHNFLNTCNDRGWEFAEQDVT